MSEGKNKRRRKVAFFLQEPLTKVLPATAGSGARQCVNLSELTKYTEVI